MKTRLSVTQAQTLNYLTCLNVKGCLATPSLTHAGGLAQVPLTQQGAQRSDSCNQSFLEVSGSCLRGDLVRVQELGRKDTFMREGQGLW